MNVDSAIDLLKSGGNLDQIIISDLAMSKVRVMDALLLAQNGCVVPDGNIVYDDDQIQYDPDFDDVSWGKPVPFKKLRQSWETDKSKTEVSISLQEDIRQWIEKNDVPLEQLLEKLLDDFYQAQKMGS